MTLSLEIAIIGLIQALSVAIIGGLFARDSSRRKKAAEDIEARAALRAEESRLAMKLMSADMGLTMVTARAVKEGKTNGEMEAALTLAENVKAEYYGFLNHMIAKQLTK